MSSDRAVQLNANSTVSATVGLPLVDVCSVSVIAFTICACLESYSMTTRVTQRVHYLLVMGICFGVLLAPSTAWRPARHVKSAQPDIAVHAHKHALSAESTEVATLVTVAYR